jgi:hypothetical protein
MFRLLLQVYELRKKALDLIQTYVLIKRMI